MNWTIVIPTWKRAALLSNTLDSLSSQKHGDFEVVVVCDGADAATSELSRTTSTKFPIRWFFHAQNLGLAAARNAGAQHATGDYLLFLDDDVIASPELLSAHNDEHRAAPEWPEYAVFGRTIEERQSEIRSATDRFLQRAWERSLAESQPEFERANLLSVGDEGERTVWFGLNCSIKRELFAALGGFDPQIRTDEESEFGFRLYRAGVQSQYARSAVVRHRGTRDLSEYYPRCWRSSGTQDLHRVRDLGERGAQTAQLAGMTYGSAFMRMVRRAIWASPGATLQIARLLERSTDATGSSLAFGAWARLRNSAEYWSAVKGSGISGRELAALARPAARILLFHSVSIPKSPQERTYYISPRKFGSLLMHARDSGYRFTHPRDWLTGNIGDRATLLTFDDAYDDLYSELLPIARRENLNPLVFVVAGQVGGANIWDRRQNLRERKILTLVQMREMQDCGFVFGAHSMSHTELPILSSEALRREVADSKHRLEDMLGREVEWFAYPFGAVDRRVRAAVLEAGFKAAMTTHPGLDTWQDPLALNRIEFSECDSALQSAIKLRTGWSLRANMSHLAQALRLHRGPRQSDSDRAIGTSV